MAKKKITKRSKKIKKKEQLPIVADNTTTNITMMTYVMILIVVGVSIATLFFITQDTSIKGPAAVDEILAQEETTTKTEQVLPNIKLTIITDSTCKECFNLGMVTQQMEMEMPANVSTERLEYTSPEAQALISQYQLKIIPVLIITGNVNDPLVSNMLDPTGEYHKNDAVVYDESIPPYVEISTGEIRGIVDTIYLEDEACVECYDVGIHKMILYSSGVYLKNENTIDINSDEGQELVDKYNITEVPTVLISSEISAYFGFDDMWSTIGTIEEDDWHVFRGNAIWKEKAITAGDNTFIYKDLTTGEIIQ